jgi:hypothetical protein
VKHFKHTHTHEIKAEVSLDGVLLAIYHTKHVIRKIASALTDTQNVHIEVKRRGKNEEKKEMVYKRCSHDL